MTTKLSRTVVWKVLDKQLFAVLGMVTKRNESRTVGITYIVEDGRLYINSQKDAWKVRHIANNRNVSMTVPVFKRIPFLPFIKIPAATITFSAEATVINPPDLPTSVRKRLYRGSADDSDLLATTAAIVVQPKGDFLTYGIGVPMWQMANREKARGRVAVQTA